MENDTRKLFDVVMLRVEDIDPDPEQPRREMRKITELARSMSEYGQLHPISVRAIGNRYRIIGGERRWTAAKSLGWQEIAAYVATTDDAEASLLELADNLHDPLTPEERDQGTQRTFAFDVPAERIAAATGYGIETVTRAQATYASLGDPVKAAMMSLEQLAAADELTGEERQRILDAKPNEWTRTLADIKREQRLEALAAEKRAIVEAAGVELLDERDYSRDVLGHGDAAPEGAVAASISLVLNDAVVVWYGTNADTDQEVIAEREKRAADREHLDERKRARIAFIADHVQMSKPLRDVVDAAWNRTGAFTAEGTYTGYTPLPRLIADTPCAELHGTATQMFASVLLACEGAAGHLLADETPNEYDAANGGKQSLAYIDALEATGYKPSELEAERIAGLRKALKPKRKKKEASE